MYKEFSTAFSSHIEAWSFIRKNNLYGWFLLPVLFNIALFILGYYAAVGGAEKILSFFGDQLLKIDDGGVIESVFFVIVFILIRILIFIAFSFVGGYLIVFLSAPVLALLSRIVLKKSGAPVKRGSSVIEAVYRSMVLTVKHLFLQIIILILSLFSSFLPVAGFAVPIVLLIISARMFGEGFIDLSLAHSGVSFKASRRIASKTNPALIGLGTPITCLLAIPFLGQLMAGFAAVLSTVAAARLKASGEIYSAS